MKGFVLRHAAAIVLLILLVLAPGFSRHHHRHRHHHKNQNENQNKNQDENQDPNQDRQIQQQARSSLLASASSVSVESSVDVLLSNAARSANQNLLAPAKSVQLSRGDASAPSVFIAIGSAPKKHELRDAVRRTWLTACVPPSCAYRFFTDANVTLKDELGLHARKRKRLQGVPRDVITTPAEDGGYSNFGRRALLQIEWSLRNADFDHYLRLDDDGLLCVQHLMHDLKQLPLTRLFWGKFWCQHMARMDENFMLMSRDVAFVLATGWRSGLLPFRQQMSLDKLTANLQPMMNLDIVAEKYRIRWLGGVLKLPDGKSPHDPEYQPNDDESNGFEDSSSMRSLKQKRKQYDDNSAGNVCLGHYTRQNTYNFTDQVEHWKKVEAETWATCPDICHRFVWLHHLAPVEITRLYTNAVPFDPTSPRLAQLPSPESRQESPTQCRSWKGFPLFDTTKTSGKKFERRNYIQNQSCFWTWCTTRFGGECCDEEHKDAMRAKLEHLFSAYAKFDAALQ